MATKTFEELKQLAIQIRDEKTNKQNTATRVGTAMLEHINKLEQDYYDKNQTDEELKERDDKLTELEGQVLSIDVKETFYLEQGLVQKNFYIPIVLKKGDKISILASSEDGESSNFVYGYINSEGETKLNVAVAKLNELIEYILPEDIKQIIGYVETIYTSGTFSMKVLKDSISSRVDNNRNEILSLKESVVELNEVSIGLSYELSTTNYVYVINLTKPFLLVKGVNVSFELKSLDTDTVQVYLIRENGTYNLIKKLSIDDVNKKYNYILTENVKTLRFYSTKSTFTVKVEIKGIREDLKLAQEKIEQIETDFYGYNKNINVSLSKNQGEDISVPHLLIEGAIIKVNLLSLSGGPLYMYLLRDDGSYINIGALNIGEKEYTLTENFKTLRIYSVENSTFESTLSISSNEQSLKNIEKNVGIPNVISFRIFRRTGCIGDSYMSGHIQLSGEEASPFNLEYSWPHYMEIITGNTFSNWGQSGSTAKQWVTTTLIDKIKEKGNKCQAYLVALMINDAGSWSEYKTPVGTIDDIGTDADTYYAFYYKLIQELIKVNELAKIFCFTCFVFAENYSYNNAVRDIVQYCRERGQNVFLCDAAKYNTSYYFKNPIFKQDSISGHYTAIGYEFMAECHTKILSDVINSNVVNFQDVYKIPYDEVE